MPWVKIPANGGMGVEAQEILRWHNAPVASVKRREGHWECSLLNVSGISCVLTTIPHCVAIDVVRDRCEEVLISMGWQRPGQQQGGRE